MNSIIIASAFSLLYFIVMTLTLRIFPIKNKAKLLSFLYFLFIFIMIIFYYLDLNIIFIQSNINITNSLLDLIFCAFIFSAAFFGGFLQLYNLADRGLSLRILIDIYESKSHSLSLDEVMTCYSSGKGIEWMYEKRIEGMLDAELVKSYDQNLCLTQKGKKVAMLFKWLRVKMFIELPDQNKK